MSMVQYGLFPNCSNKCDFCLLKEREYLTKEQILHRINYIINNIPFIDWEDKFSDGISLLGGELYFTTDIDIQQAFLNLIDTIIEKILSKSKNPYCKYSTVTNGIYNPEFLFKVMDKFQNTVGLDKVDLNFSYDLKYRFHSEESRLLCLENIKKFNERYNSKISVQMILTQNLINLYNNKEFEFNDFISNTINNNRFFLLYPHKIRTGKVLNDFFFKRNDFLNFIIEINNRYPEMADNFFSSVINSSKFKYSGYLDRDTEDIHQQPVLEKEKATTLSECGHSILYQCYSDSDKCMLCDILEVY